MFPKPRASLGKTMNVHAVTDLMALRVGDRRNHVNSGSSTFLFGDCDFAS